MIGRILTDNGYHSAWFGKNHPLGATRDAKRSKPGHAVWVLIHHIRILLGALGDPPCRQFTLS